MLERIRSLEDTRGKQIAQATTEFTTVARHSADAQREVISSVETILKSEAFIRASVGGISKSCDVLRASLPRQSALDPHAADRRRRRPHPVFDQQYVCRPRPQRPALFPAGA